MKHTSYKLAALLMSAALCATAASAAESAASVLYPSEVREVQAGDFRRIEKVYLMEAGADPAAIPTGGFEREGYRYALLDLLREDRTKTERREHTETVTQPSDTQDMSAILNKLDATLPFADEDGFSGTLALDPKSITVEAAGYRTSTKTVTASRTYPSLSDADTSLIPKTVEDSGRTLELSNVSWQTVPGGNDALSATYTATASYTGTASGRYATGYTVTARYAGELARTVSGNVVYTAVFTGTAIAPPAIEAPGEVTPTLTRTVCIILAASLVLTITALCAQEIKRRKELKRHEKAADPRVVHALLGSDHSPGDGSGV